MSEPTPEQVEFRSQVARFVESEITPNATAWDRDPADHSYPMHLFGQLGELGWLGVGFDESLGGSGGGPIERCIMFEELARGSAGAALGIYVHTSLAAAGLGAVANPALIERFVPPLLAGTLTGAWAYAEPDAGADVTQVRLSAKRDGDNFVLNGTKMYITNATFADVILVVVRTNGEPGQLSGLSVLAVDGESEGLTRTPMAKLGMRPSEIAELHFDECIVPADRLVGEVDTGFRQCLAVLSQGRVYAGALALGLGRAAMETAVTHVTTRQQFGGPLAAKQAVRLTVAEMTARLRGVRELVYSTATKLAEGEPYDTDASITKLVSSETATWVSERCLHLHGANGYMLDSPAQRFYRDCKINEWGEGANELQREMVFEAVTKGYRP
ncbi:MAG: acyl-CoA/acyl-ACP dehydrogenase [Actinomycetia bacterium]|nr:acyl-CoA/acyl-ACP dehydrogenase [Actinomycetes bacterium]MCP4224133.1 acyl-CoA/acyl-ACP dehydrogenase [Actinomycetes bacterium]